MASLLAQITNINQPSTIFTASQSLVGQFTSRFLLYAIGLSGFYFLIRFLMGAFTSLTALGNPEKIAAAQKMLLNSLIGLLVVLSAYFLAQILQFVLGIRFL